METHDLLTKAQHALRTGQPRLAKLYMRKALEQTDQHRRELDPIGWQGRQLVKGISAFAQGFARVGIAFTSLADGIKRAYTAEELGRKSDYALVAGRRG